MDGYVKQSMEEALETLNNLLIHMKNLNRAEIVYALAEGIVALEKQIPKKPQKEFNGMESLAICECGADIYSFPSSFKGCPYCLQVIDWSGV